MARLTIVHTKAFTPVAGAFLLREARLGLELRLKAAKVYSITTISSSLRL